MTIYSAVFCAALMWLLLWCLWPGPRRDNCGACAWRRYPRRTRCVELDFRDIPADTQAEIIAGRLICPCRFVERPQRNKVKRWWERG